MGALDRLRSPGLSVGPLVPHGVPLSRDMTSRKLSPCTMVVLHRPWIIGFCDETVPVKRGIPQGSSRFRIMPAGNEPGRLLPSSQNPPTGLDRLQGKVSRDIRFPLIPGTSSKDISHLPVRHPAAHLRFRGLARLRLRDPLIPVSPRLPAPSRRDNSRSPPPSLTGNETNGDRAVSPASLSYHGDHILSD